jgi:dienelactone hydrolase
MEARPNRTTPTGNSAARRALARVLGAALAGAVLGMPAFAASPTPEAKPASATQSPAAIAQQLLEDLDAGRFEAVSARFSDTMRQAVPTAALQQVWTALPQQAGARTGRGDASVHAEGGVTRVDIPLQHAKAALVLKVALDAQGQVVGLLVQPAPPPAAAAPDPQAGFAERELRVGDGARALPATLAMPKGAGPFPAVVLVHGSGPQDRDETIGANRPFLDLARGLAARGVAVLRYEKRSHARPQDFAGGVTLDAETTDDAVAAVAALRREAGIDPERIAVFGHSQGGMLGPRIARRSGASGAILLAAPARPLLDLLLEQNRRVAAMDGETSPAERDFIARLEGVVARIRAAQEVPAADSPLGLPASYWREIDAVDAVAEARDTAFPLLLLQGGRDIQVVDADWQRWQAAFAGQPRATLRHYPALNHLAIAGEGPGTLEEYGRPGQVDTGLIEDVARWIHAL